MRHKVPNGKIEVRTHLSPEILAEIKVVAVREGISVKEVLEQACLMLLDQRQKKERAA